MFEALLLKPGSPYRRVTCATHIGLPLVNIGGEDADDDDDDDDDDDEDDDEDDEDVDNDFGCAIRSSVGCSNSYARRKFMANRTCLRKNTQKTG
jgi:hypothetical protein